MVLTETSGCEPPEAAAAHDALTTIASMKIAAYTSSSGRAA